MSWNHHFLGFSRFSQYPLTGNGTTVVMIINMIGEKRRDYLTQVKEHIHTNTYTQMNLDTVIERRAAFLLTLCILFGCTFIKKKKTKKKKAKKTRPCRLSSLISTLEGRASSLVNSRQISSSSSRISLLSHHLKASRASGIRV